MSSKYDSNSISFQSFLIIIEPKQFGLSVPANSRKGLDSSCRKHLENGPGLVDARIDGAQSAPTYISAAEPRGCILTASMPSRTYVPVEVGLVAQMHL